MAATCPLSQTLHYSSKLVFFQSGNEEVFSPFILSMQWQTGKEENTDTIECEETMNIQDANDYSL